jgi:hypothetical protein
MAFKAVQITLVANTATPLLVQGTTGTRFLEPFNGTVSDPIPCQFMVTSGTVFWGGPDVDATHGFPLVANSPVVSNLYGTEIPYVFSTGTPVVYVVLGRQ